MLALCVQTPWQAVIYYFLLAAKCAVSGVFVSYPHPGGQGLAKLDHSLYTLFKLV